MSAVDVVRHLHRLAARALEQEWWEEPIGISVDASIAIFRHGQFEHLARHERDGIVTFDLEWRRQGGSLTDLIRDFYALFGAIAEEASFVHRQIEDGVVVFSTVFGATENHAHGHVMVFRIGGPWARQAAERLAALRAEGFDPRVAQWSPQDAWTAGYVPPHAEE